MNNQTPPLLSAAARASLRKAMSIFLSGLFAVLPILVTFSLVMWMIGAAESIFGGLLNALLPGESYRRGMGLVVAFGIIFGIGLAMQGVVSRQVLSWIDNNLNRIPLVKTIYGAVRDLTDMVSSKGGQKLGRVVLLQWPEQPVRMVGFVTLEDLSRFHLAAEDDCVAVYLPMSYQIGGHTLLIPRRYVTPLDMSLEEAMRFVITAGVSRNEAVNGKPPPSP